MPLLAFRHRRRDTRARADVGRELRASVQVLRQLVERARQDAHLVREPHFDSGARVTRGGGS